MQQNTAPGASIRDLIRAAFADKFGPTDDRMRRPTESLAAAFARRLGIPTRPAVNPDDVYRHVSRGDRRAARTRTERLASYSRNLYRTEHNQ